MGVRFALALDRLSESAASGVCMGWVEKFLERRFTVNDSARFRHSRVRNTRRVVLLEARGSRAHALAVHVPWSLHTAWGAEMDGLKAQPSVCGGAMLGVMKCCGRKAEGESNTAHSELTLTSLSPS